MKNILLKYLDSYYKKIDRTITFVLKDKIKNFVVIPAYKETFETIIKTINSVDQAASDKEGVCLVVLINYKSGDDDEIKKQSRQLYEQLKQSTCRNLKFYTFCEEMNSNHAGVGLARKMLMDFAFRYFYKKNLDGLIFNLDADTVVDENYFDNTISFFNQHADISAASIAFAHPVKSNDLTHRAIIEYELHLRYFINKQRLIHLPFAYQTVGSAMVVRASAYAKVGGMPKKQAGEDFYFMQKFAKNMSLADINSTIVRPLGRTSDRVPFGTGRAVMQFNQSQLTTSYNPLSFQYLREWIVNMFSQLKNRFEFRSALLDHQNNSFTNYLVEFKVEENMKRILNNVSSFDNYEKQFYQWFDAFQLMKYLHFMRDQGIKDLSINKCVQHLFNILSLEYKESMKENLLAIREYDLSTDYYNQWRAGRKAKSDRI